MYNRGNVVVVFDGTFDCFLCIIYAFYYEKLLPSRIVCDKFFQQSLEAEYVTVALDVDKAKTVAKAIRKKISYDCYETLYLAFLNANENRYIDLLNYVVAGFKIGADIERYAKWDFVLRTYAYAKRVFGEAHLFKGFLRFKDTRQGVLYAEIEPENNVLPIVADHFCSRLINEKWMIHDTKRCIAAIYDGVALEMHEVPAKADVSLTDDEEYFQGLWQAFFNQIAIKERVSRKRQRGVVPIKYRKNMIEFGKINPQSADTYQDTTGKGGVGHTL